VPRCRRCLTPSHSLPHLAAAPLVPASPDPACQPCAPTSPSPAVLPCRSRAHRTCEACAARCCQSSPEPVRPCHAGPHRRTPTPLSAPFSPPHGASPRTPTPPLPPPPPLQNEPAATPHSLLPPSLSSTHGHASVTRSPPFPASRPRWRPSRRSHHRISDLRRHRSPTPTVRLAYLPPLPYLGPPSPLLSSSTAPGADRSHRRPSLRRGTRRAPSHRAATPPCSRPPPLVSPTLALVARRPPGGPHELTGNALPPASHHRPVGDRATTSSRAR
jgi:hypothetical protein